MHFLIRRLPLAVTRKNMSSASASEEILFQERGTNAGLITLNKPKALNALNHDMVTKMYSKLSEWKSENRVKVIVVEGAGDKAFCAGGDIRAITREKGSQLQKDFFRNEYKLDALTASLPGYVALLDGFAMGGGVGISAHVPYRVATERTVFAMPETGIGLVPDVGGSFFLPRLKHSASHSLGTYLGLTGDRLKGADCLHSGIATHFCHSEKLGALKDELFKAKDHSDIAGILEKHAETSTEEAFGYESNLERISKSFGKPTVEEIMSELAKMNDEWSVKTAKKLSKLSPTSLKVALRMLQEGAKLPSLEECLKMEYRLVRRCCEGSDFYEGVRALLLDKDNAPDWSPSTIEAVREELVQSYFAKLPESEELKF